jgi:Na+/melibiose symporter-like transporter
MSTLPAVLGLAVVGLSMLYRLSTEDERQIAAELRERKRLGAAPASA